MTLKLPDTGAEGAARVARKLLELVRELAIEHADSDASPVVSVSLGVATVVPVEGLDAKALIEAYQIGGQTLFKMNVAQAAEVPPKP